jgi:hypothetical protein
MCFGFQENIDGGAEDEHTTKHEDMNTESTKAIEEQTIIDDTENMQIDEVIP